MDCFEILFDLINSSHRLNEGDLSLMKEFPFMYFGGLSKKNGWDV